MLLTMTLSKMYMVKIMSTNNSFSIEMYKNGTIPDFNDNEIDEDSDEDEDEEEEEV